jgi:hypothetical protein
MKTWPVISRPFAEREMTIAAMNKMWNNFFTSRLSALRGSET